MIGALEVVEALRIDILIDHLELGGSEIQTLRLAKALARRGHDVRLTSLSGAPESPLPQQQTASRDGVQVIVPDPPGLRAVPAVLKDLRKRQPDIIYAVLIRAGLLSVIARATSRRSVVVVSRRYHPAMLRWHRRVLRELPVLLCDAVVANSRSAVQDRVSRAVIGRSTVAVICNELPQQCFEQVRPLDVEGRPVIGCVANLRDGKGHMDLFAAAALLREHGRPVSLLLAGQGPLRERLQKAADAAGIQVRFLGRVDDVREVIAACDVMVQASLSEGFPNAMVEAMAQGAAIVATDVGGTREALSNAALLIPAGQPAVLAGAISALLDDEALRARLQKRALERAREIAGADPAALFEALFIDLAGRGH